MIADVTDRPLFAHVGCSKTGSSSLQAGLWDSVPALEAQGLGVPFVGRSAHRRRLLDPFGWQPAKGFVGPWDEPALDLTARRLGEVTSDRVLISCEDLVELGAEGVERLVALAVRGGTQIRPVVTLRDWAQQIPSEYLQFLRHGMTETYPDFLVQVRNREGRWAEHFWRRQDPLDILSRWRCVDPSRIQLIVVPSYSADPDGVFRLMGEAIGLDHTLVRRPDHAVNASHGVVEAEVFRRVNAALPAAFDDYSPAYKSLIRLPFTREVLPSQASDRLLLPDSDLDWVAARARDVVAGIRSSGCRVLGDLDDLLPSASRTAPYGPPSEAEVARVSVETLARFAERTRRLLAEAADPLDPPVPAADHVEQPTQMRAEALHDPAVRPGAATGVLRRGRKIFRR